MSSIMLERSGNVKPFFRPGGKYLTTRYPLDLLRHRNYPLPPYPLREVKAKVTIVVALRCRNGLVLAADQLISFAGSHNYYEEKISTLDHFGWHIVFGYAGSPIIYKALKKSVTERLLSFPGEAMSTQALCELTNGELERLIKEKQWGKYDQFLLAVSGPNIPTTKAFVFQSPQKGLLPAEDFTCMGVGESSLIRYLATTLYSPLIHTDLGENLAIYMVAKAIKHIDHCGGPINAVTLHDGLDPDYLTEEDTAERRGWMEYMEKHYLKQVIDAADMRNEPDLSGGSF